MGIEGEGEDTHVGHESSVESEAISKLMAAITYLMGGHASCCAGVDMGLGVGLHEKVSANSGGGSDKGAERGVATKERREKSRT
jgi:hypothetical protein